MPTEIILFNFAMNYLEKINAQALLKWLLKDFLNMLYKNIVQVLCTNALVVTGIENKTLLD